MHTALGMHRPSSPLSNKLFGISDSQTIKESQSITEELIFLLEGNQTFSSKAIKWD